MRTELCPDLISRDTPGRLDRLAVSPHDALSQRAGRSATRRQTSCAPERLLAGTSPLRPFRPPNRRVNRPMHVFLLASSQMRRAEATCGGRVEAVRAWRRALDGSRKVDRSGSPPSIAPQDKRLEPQCWRGRRPGYAGSRETATNSRYAASSRSRRASQQQQTGRVASSSTSSSPQLGQQPSSNSSRLGFISTTGTVGRDAAGASGERARSVRRKG